ncbi:MAG: aminotransferase class I and II [Actinomycetota bacterium]|nr:aminotransferase class I and II [Actinomycetota bacterium]
MPVATQAQVGLSTVVATRYVTPLREGGSLPGLMEADDDGLYVVKFRGAGQGVKALVAELLAGELARRLGLDVPELVLVELDPALGRAEPDPEIQDLLDASPGLNLGVDFLPGALSYDAADGGEAVSPDLAAEIVWFDALVANVDRTPRNPNLLLWHQRLWLIDHGAAVYHQHASGDLASQARAPFPAIREHVLLPHAGSIIDADRRLAPRIHAEMVQELAALIPREWQEHPSGAYAAWLERRLAEPRVFAQEAEDARAGQ